MEAQFAVLESHVETHALMLRRNAMKDQVERRAIPPRTATVGVQHIVTAGILQLRAVVQILVEHVVMTMIAHGTADREVLENVT